MNPEPNPDAVMPTAVESRYGRGRLRAVNWTVIGRASPNDGSADYFNEGEPLQCDLLQSGSMSPIPASWTKCEYQGYQPSMSTPFYHMRGKDTLADVHFSFPIKSTGVVKVKKIAITTKEGGVVLIDPPCEQVATPCVIHISATIVIGAAADRK